MPETITLYAGGIAKGNLCYSCHDQLRRHICSPISKSLVLIFTIFGCLLKLSQLFSIVLFVCQFYLIPFIYRSRCSTKIPCNLLAFLSQATSNYCVCAAYTTLEADIGKVVAKTLLDPRTLNRQVVIKVNGTTQREIIATWEEISGRKVLLNDISAEDFRHVDKGFSSCPALELLA